MEGTTNICYCNGKEAIGIKELMDLVGYNDIDKFWEDFVEEAKIMLTRRGESFENHILDISTPLHKHLMPLFSALAARTIAMIAANKHRDKENSREIAKYLDDIEYATLQDTSFFVDFNNPKRNLRVGDKVEIITTTPDVLYPATAMISYKGKHGVIVNKSDNGNFNVVINGMIPAAEFKPSHLRLRKEQ